MPTFPAVTDPRAPYRVTSTLRVDNATIASLAPGLRSNFRLAAGVAKDIAHHLVGEPVVTDCFGALVPDVVWQKEIRTARSAAVEP